MPAYSKYPSSIDDSTSLPISTDLVTPVVAEVTNRLRDSILKIQNELGINPSAEYGNVKDRLDALQKQLLTIVAAGQAGNLTLFSCDSSLSIGQVVAQNGESVLLASASDPNLPAIGFIAEKPSAELAYVKLNGEISLSGLVAGSRYYLSDIYGEITTSEPSNPGSFIQYLGFAKNSSTFVMQISTSVVFL